MINFTLPSLFALIFSCLSIISNAQISSNVNFRGQLTYSNDLADIWGWRNPADNKEYALVGVTNGFSIVDVSIPESPNQVQFVSGTNTLWRDVKTWGNYAYVVNEGGGGLLIVNMSNLPGSISTFSWNGGIGFARAHNIFIDENGIAYLCGSNGSLGTLMLDLNVNPTNPPIVGSYTTRYVHDLYVRGDTMWTAEINNGIFSVIDISNKAAPVVMATQSTSSNFTHNLWLSDNGQYLFTTDEVSGANVDAYDVSDLSDIRELDRFRPGTGPNSAPHNVFANGNFLLTAWYRDGLRITDATQPNNMIEVGWYDTSPLSGSGFNGAWGVYPYLPSGNALVTDIEQGLFVLTPTYVGAAFLQGLVTDQSSGLPLFNATVSIAGTSASSLSSILGQYATGLANAGTYTINVSRAGYVSQSISGVSLSSGSTTILNVALVPSTAFTLNGQVENAATGSGIAGAKVLLESASSTFEATANSSGSFAIAAFPGDVYDVYAGSWGFSTILLDDLSLNLGAPVLLLPLNFGYADDFMLDQGWTVSGDAVAGIWERGVPIGTSFGGVQANPGADIPGDLGNKCFVTGNGGGAVGFDDVDDGETILTSPVFDLSGGGDPYVNYHRWFYNGGGSGTPNDSLIIRLSNGSTTATLEIVTVSTPGNSSWQSRSFRILDYLALSANMQIIVSTADRPGSGHLVEAGFDGFSISGAVPPGCSPPTGLFTSNLSSNSARVNWTPVPGALNHQIQGRKVGTSNFRSITTTASSRNIASLSPGTSYEWQVRVQCAGGGISAFSPLQTFTTLIPKTGVEFSAHFEPNPAVNFTHMVISLDQDQQLLRRVMDLSGRVVLQDQVEGLSGIHPYPLDLSKLIPGYYLVELAGDMGTQQLPIVVSR